MTIEPKPILKPMSNRERKFWRIAIHEASHAVAAEVIGHRVDNVSVGSVPNSTSRGRCAYSRNEDGDSRDQIRNLAVLYASGHVGETLFAADSSPWPPTSAMPQLPIDPQSATPRASDAPLGDIGVIEALSRIDRDRDFRSPDPNERREEREVKAFIGRIRPVVVELLYRHETAVRLLALELINSGVVDASRVRAIIDANSSEEIRHD